MKFNINDNVKVKLTPLGWELHRKYWTPFCTDGYIPPTADANGYVTFQLWDLMAQYGPHIGNGLRNAFDTVIEI